MKLQEFFDTQKNITFTDKDKLHLYQDILYKTTKRNSLKRVSFVRAKYLMYSMVVGILVFGLYGVYFVNDGWLRKYMSSKNNTVQADYIAQVIDAQGKFFIEKNGILTKESQMSNGDAIVLREDSELVLEIDEGTQSKIVWPAKLILQKTEEETYKLNLVYGDFIQMEGKKEKKQSIEVAINNNDIVVKQENDSQPVNFKFIQEWDNQIIQNNWANIVMTKDDTDEKPTTIINEEIVTIQDNDIKVFANLDSFAQSIQPEIIEETTQTEIIEGNIETGATQTGTTQTEIIAKTEPEMTEKTSQLLQLLSMTSINSDKEEQNTTDTITPPTIEETISGATIALKSSWIANNSGILTAKSIKKVLNIEEEIHIYNNLNSNIYKTEIKELEIAFLEGNLETFNPAYSQIEQKIENIYNILEIPYYRTGNHPKEYIQGLVNAISIIRENLSGNYENGTQYNDNLNSMSRILNSITYQEYGSAAVHNSASGEDIKTITK